MDSGPYRFFALNCTGALPVSYIPGGGAGKADTMKAEDSAYHFFRGTGDSHLARVVQYAALYQIFTNFGPTPLGKEQEPPPRSIPLLTREGRRLLDNIRTASSADLRQMGARVIHNQTFQGPVDELISERLQSAGRKLTKSDLADLAADVSTEILQGLENFKSFLIEQYEDGGESRMNAIADRLVRGGLNSRTGLAAAKSAIISTYNTDGEDAAVSAMKHFVERAWQGNDLTSVILLRYFDELNDLQLSLRQVILSDLLPSLEDIRDLQQKLVDAGAPRMGTWIHTPTIVVSENSGELSTGTGGHNLSAEVSPLRLSNAVPKGTLKLINEDGTQAILCNPTDAGKVELLAYRRLPVRLDGSRG